LNDNSPIDVWIVVILVSFSVSLQTPPNWREKMAMDSPAQQEVAPQTETRLARRLMTKDAWVNIVLAILSGVLAGLAFSPFELWPLAWIALVPLLIALRRASALRFAGYLALLFGMSLCAVSLSWMTAIFGPLVIGIFFLASLPWLLFGLAYRTLIDRSPLWAVMLLAPVFWLAVEWIRCEGWYFRFSWLQLGFTIIPNAHLSSLYPLIGVYGITFLIVLVNVALVLLLTRRDWRPPVAMIGVVGILLIVSLAYRAERSGVRHHSPSSNGLIVQNESGTLDDLLQSTRMAITPATRLVVWPEYALPEYLLEERLAQRDLQDIQAFARVHRCTLVLGAKKHAPNNAPCDWLRRRGMKMEGGLFYNIALVIGPDGKVLGDYAKTHPIQFFADGVPGRSYKPIDTPAGRLGIAICYDMDYAHTALRLVRNGADVLVAPTYDALNWGATQHRQHTRMAQARAAEVSRFMLRATSSGISQIVAPDGRALASSPFGESAATAGPFALMTIITPYVRFMWLLPYLCLGISLLWVLSLIIRRRPTK